MPQRGGFSRTSRALAALAVVVWSAAAGAWAVDPADVRLLSSPAITVGRIAFVYADDVWTAEPDGSRPRRLTSHPGAESRPRFSPDGKTVAFTAAYDGNLDVYTIPVDGGEPTRLTWHPGDDLVRGFTPSGDVLFASQREVFSHRHSQFLTAPAKGGVPKKLPIPSGDMGAVSPDGAYLAYTPLGERFRQWKNYRGGATSRIWVLKLADLSHVEIPRPETGANDTAPSWIGSTVFFLSDRDGEFNVYSYDLETKAVARRTNHLDFPVETASTGAGKVIYDQSGYLYVYDPNTGETTRLKVPAAADLTETRPRRVSDPKYVRSADVSPTGKRAVLEYRGEIVTVPAKKGDPRNLTQTPGAHERSPVWSPDGRSIAYFSDASGEYALHVQPQDGKGETRTFPLTGSGFYERPVWSPDSRRIAFLDNARTLSYIDLETAAVKRIDAEPVYSPNNTMTASWSPDSKWLAYTLDTRAGIQTVRLYSLDLDRSTPLTDGLAEAGSPVFDAGGKHLYFVASTDAGPAKSWFDQSVNDMPVTSTLYLAALQKDAPNPLLKPSDEEGADPARDQEKDKEKEKEKEKDAAPPPSPVKPTVVDLEGVADRIVALPVESGMISDLAAGPEGQVYYVHRPASRPSRDDGGMGKPTLRRFDLKTREDQEIAADVGNCRISADRKKLLYRAGETVGIVDAGKFNKGDGAVGAVGAVSIAVDPRAEWAQIFREAWRINRDFFYAPNMHGADWAAVRARYETFLPHLACRGDLDRVIRGMLSELSVGHSYLFTGDRMYEPRSVPIGLLGADFEAADGRFKFKTIYGGAFWDPALRAPLKAPGVNVAEGEYLLAVDGAEVKADSEVYKHFEQTVGRRVELKVGPKPDGADARTVVVEPIADESALRNRAWIEANLRKVHERTKGRVAYIYVPDTAARGYSYFKRYFYPQADKDAAIIDERFNGGGQVADYYIGLLRRPVVSYWATRYGEPLRTPNAAIPGPKAMIIDETAGSGGDMLPWMFRKFELGPLVGKRTWGGLVGILGYPVLMDGARVTAPDLAIFTDKGWIVENQGVAPDVEVEQDPAAMASGADPQLDKAIEIVLQALEKNPPAPRPSRPADPVRVRPAPAAAPVPAAPAAAPAAK